MFMQHRHPSDWTMMWGGSGTIYGWGHNHRGQLGGVEGAKVKLPQPCEALAAIRPVQIIGGEQTLFAVTSEGKVRPLDTCCVYKEVTKADCCCMEDCFYLNTQSMDRDVKPLV